MFQPWVYVPYGDGGETELQFNYVLKDGTKGSKTWKFKLEKADKLGIQVLRVVLIKHLLFIIYRRVYELI